MQRFKMNSTIEHWNYAFLNQIVDRAVRETWRLAKTKFSYGVLRQLSEIGYDILPINPNPNLKEIRGLKVYRSLEEIEKPIDMVDVFRPKEELYAITDRAIAVGAKVLWAQIGVYDDKAAKLAEEAGLKVVMNRCPKIELFRPFWKPRLDLEI